MATRIHYSFLTAAVVTTNSTSPTVTEIYYQREAVLMLRCTAFPTGGSPTLDCYFQHSPDGGTTWQDLAHSQYTATSATRLFLISGEGPASTTAVAGSDAALSGESTVQGPFGDRLRLKYVFAAGGSSGSYTLTATGLFK